MMNQSIRIVLLTLAANLMMSGGARAEQTWLCAVSSAVAVDEDGTVGPPDMGDRERPTFFRVDSAKKELTLLAPASRRGEVTKIELVHEADGHRVFSGIEHGRSLNLIINAEGRLSLSVLGDGVVWSVFGNVLPEGESNACDASTECEAKAAAETETEAKETSKDESNAASTGETKAAPEGEAKK
jgi:hypothetical protein